MAVPGVPPGYPQAPGRRPGWHGGRIVGAVLALLAAGAAVTGSLLALFQGEVLFQGEAQLRLTVTGWDLSGEALQPGVPANTFGSPVRNGYLLAFAALLLLIAAVLGVAAARRTASPGRKLAAALATATGAAFLLATAAGIVLQGVSLHESFRPTGDGFTVGDRFGLGFWLVAGATLAAIVAAVLATTRGRRALDPVTPRYGIPAPPSYRPGPQFPAPTMHWPGGEPYPGSVPTGRGTPPYAGFAPAPPHAWPVPPPPGRPDPGWPAAGQADVGWPTAGQPDAARPAAGQAPAGHPDVGWPTVRQPDAARPAAGQAPASQPGRDADISPGESPWPEQPPGTDRPHS